MRKAAMAVLMLALMACVFAPSVRFTEDKTTVQLARTIYALGKAEDYETKLALGTVAMNRVDSAWFPDELGAVLSEQQQFPAGSRYDDESLRAAHALIAGERALAQNALYYRAADASRAWDESCVASSGGYRFYERDGNR